MNPLQIATKICQVLNQGTRLDAPTIERLRAARERALAVQRVGRAPELAWANNLLGRVGGWQGLSWRLMLPLLLVAVSAGALYSWQQTQRSEELVELDALVLSGDLPIDAYLDRGFETWLKKRAAR